MTHHAGYAARVPIYDPNKPLITKGAERVWRWSFFLIPLILLGLAIVAVAITRVAT